MQSGESSTQFERALLQIRQMILDGEFPSGVHIAEIPLAERLKVSRTPVRLALGVLEQEGLLESVPRRGFTVREITADHIINAFDVRGALEGLACRLLVERGPSSDTITALNVCIKEGDALLANGKLSSADAQSWSKLNVQFHRQIIDAAGSQQLADVIAFNNRVPLVSAGAIAFTATNLDLAFRYMQQAHSEHCDIVDAINARQAARAEALAVEHAYKSRKNIELLLTSVSGRNAPLRLRELRLVAR